MLLAGVAAVASHYHLIPALPAHPVALHDGPVTIPPGLYTIRLGGRLGPTARSAFPALVCEFKGGETVLTGLLADQSALFGVLGQIEALGLELLELRKIRARPAPREPCDERRRMAGETITIIR